MTKRIFALFLLLITALLLFPACNQKETSRRYKRTETELFDTVCSFSCAGDKEEFDRTADLLFEELARLDALFDVYEEKEGMNTLFTVNKMAGVAPVKVDPLLIDFFLYINQLPKDLTALAHPMMGAVTLLWKEGQKTGVPPGQASLDLAKNHIDPSSLIVNEEEGTLFISDPDARIDVGAFAKGYAGRLCVALLEKRQVNDYLLSLGGSIYAEGIDPTTGKPFRIGVQDPFKTEDSPLLSVPLTDRSLTTSGSYRRFFSHEGTIYHHIIDPETAAPSARSDTLSVSVFAADPALGDLLSTVLFILPPKEGKALLESPQMRALDPSLSALWIDGKGEITHSDGFPYDPPFTPSHDSLFALFLLAAVALLVLLLLILRKKQGFSAFVKKHPLFFSKKNLIFLAAIAVICALLLCTLSALPTAKGKVAVVRHKGQVVKILPLSNDTEYLFVCDAGENLIVIKDGRVSVKEASCRGNDCVKAGGLDAGQTLEVIACLPHGLTITVEEGENHE